MGSLQSAILGFGVFKVLQCFEFMQGFTMEENVIVQTTSVATATMPLAAGMLLANLQTQSVEQTYMHAPVRISTHTPALHAFLQHLKSTTSRRNKWHLTHDVCLALHRGHHHTCPAANCDLSYCSCVMTTHRFGGGDTSYGNHDSRTEPAGWPSHPVIWSTGALVTGLGFSGSLLCSAAAHSDHSEGEAAVPLRNSHCKCHQDPARSSRAFQFSPARASTVCGCHS